MPRFSKLDCRAVFVPFFPVESENAKLGGLVSSPTGGRPKGPLSQSLIEGVRAGGGQQFQVGWVGGSPIPHSFIHSFEEPDVQLKETWVEAWLGRRASVAHLGTGKHEIPLAEQSSTGSSWVWVILEGRTGEHLCSLSLVCSEPSHLPFFVCSSS